MLTLSKYIHLFLVLYISMVVTGNVHHLTVLLTGSTFSLHAPDLIGRIIISKNEVTAWYVVTLLSDRRCNQDLIVASLETLKRMALSPVTDSC